MTTKKKIVIGVIVLALLATTIPIAIARGRDKAVEVKYEEVKPRDLVSTVVASGNIRARRKADISSDVSARVAQVAIEEGDEVQQGQVLLRLDPAQLEAAVNRAEAALSQAKAQEVNQNANLIRATRDRDRLTQLAGLVMQQQIDDAKTAVEVAEASLQSAKFGVQQAMASLDEARDRLSKTTIRAPISGKVTRLNINEGETAIIGTTNNPGSLLLTISDLSVVEMVVYVDETEVPSLAIGDSASVDIDAFPNQKFTGRVTEIGNSAVRPPASAQASGQQAAIDFSVTITLDATEVLLRPDLSATAEIVTEMRQQVPSVPIIALTVRTDSAAADSAKTVAAANDDDEEASNDVEGVFVVSQGKAKFVPVKIGIAGADYFEILSGVQAGDTVVAGPYQAVRTLKDGDLVKPGAVVTTTTPVPEE
jgi:HlyD family secretion protein